MEFKFNKADSSVHSTPKINRIIMEFKYLSESFSARESSS